LFGDLKSGRRPLVFLHGGPGIPSFYLDVFSDLTAEHGIPLIIYDQLGCGNSTRLRDKDGSFWAEKLFMDELENLLNHLGIADDFDLGGHSWGGMLGSRFAGCRQPKGLKHLILANSLARMEDWTLSNLTLLKELPQEVQDVINHCELDANGDTNSKEYHEALGIFFDRFICRISPHPPTIAESEKALEEDNTVLRHMWGKAWLRCSNTLKDWSVVEDLPNIKVPTLVYNGKYDQSQDFVVAPFLRLIPKVKWVRFEDSAHMSHHEIRDKVMKLIGDFIVYDQ